MKKTVVSFQGEPGAFSEQAAMAYFGKTCTPIAREHFRDIFDDVVAKKGFGIIPIENSLFGSIHQNFDLLQEYSLIVIGEIKLRIRHNLLALPGVALKNIRHVYSHPQALGQSDKFLRSLKHVVSHPFYDTAGAAKMISEDQRFDSAAVASVQAGKHYGLHILRKNIETDRRNFTRFLIIAKRPITPSGRTKTSIIFATKNIPGSLYTCLSVFAQRKINLLKIESRPFIGKPWEYLFFVDIESDPRKKECALALDELQTHTSYFKNLGSYAIGKVAI